MRGDGPKARTVAAIRRLADEAEEEDEVAIAGAESLAFANAGRAAAGVRGGEGHAPAETERLALHLHRLFSAVARGRPVPAADLAALEEWAKRAALRRALVETDEGFRWHRREEPDEQAALWPIVDCAVALLTGPWFRRIRECAAAECGRLFVDRSKNGRRRWCRMAVCGNRHKARRFRGRGPF
ncbi:MAG TPA: CGNR zinc finger domain-containing protein [Alphaproteobacteria bacterium]|nr:CGNR zinc finger domain-containing protein [Alphaproteobacteria bacterium]